MSCVLDLKAFKREGLLMLLKLRCLGLLMCAIIRCSLLSAGCSFSAPLDPVLVDIKGIDKAILIRKFFKRASMGTGRINHDRAVSLLETTGGKLRYVGSNILNIDVSGDMMDAAAYNKMYGAGSAETIINACRRKNAK